METLYVWTSGDWGDLASFRAQLGEQAAIELAVGPEEAQPDVVVHVTRDAAAPGDELATIREHTNAPIVVLTAVRSASLLEDLMRGEVDEVLLLPQTAEAVAFAIYKVARARAKRESRAAGRVLTVFSPKGGTGKSVVACNLAAAVAATGRRTLLVDLDLQFGDVSIMLGLQPTKTVHDLVTAPGRLDGEKLRGYTVHHASGFDVVVAPLKPEDAEEITDTKVADLLEVASREYEVVVVDTAPFLYGPTLETLDRTTDLLLLCTPDVPALKNVRLTLQTLDLLSFDASRVHLVLNRSSARVGLRATEVGTVIDRRVEFELPEDELVTAAVNRAAPLVTFRPNAPFSFAIQSVAETLFGPATEPRARRRFVLGRTQ